MRNAAAIGPDKKQETDSGPRLRLRSRLTVEKGEVPLDVNAKAGFHNCCNGLHICGPSRQGKVQSHQGNAQRSEGASRTRTAAQPRADIETCEGESRMVWPQY